MDYFTINTNR